MKKLENKPTKIKIAGSEDTCNYGDLIVISLTTIQKQRWMPSEIRLINQIADVIESANGELNFENDQAKYIVDTIYQNGLPIRGKEAEQFLDDIEEMSKQK